MKNLNPVKNFKPPLTNIFQLKLPIAINIRSFNANLRFLLWSTICHYQNLEIENKVIEIRLYTKTTNYGTTDEKMKEKVNKIGQEKVSKWTRNSSQKK